MSGVGAIDSGRRTVGDSVPLIGQNVTSNHTVDSSIQGKSTTLADIAEAGDVNRVGRSNRNERVDSGGSNIATANTRLHNLNSVNVVHTNEEVVESQGLVGLTNEEVTILEPLVGLLTITTSDVSLKHRSTVVTDSGRIASSDSDGHNRISNNTVVDNLRSALTAIVVGNSHPIGVVASTVIGRSGIGSTRTNILIIVGIPIEGVEAQIRLDTTVHDSSSESGGTADAGDVVADSSLNNRVDDKRDSRRSGSDIATRVSGDNHSVVVSSLTSDLSSDVVSLSSILNQDIVLIPLIVVVGIGRSDIRVERGSTTSADRGVTLNRDSNRRSRDNGHNRVSRGHRSAARDRQLSEDRVNIASLITINSDRRIIDNRTIGTENHNTVLHPSVGGVAVRVGDRQSNLTAIANNSIVNRHNRSGRDFVHVDRDRVSSSTTVGRLGNSHHKGVSTSSSRSEGVSTTLEAIVPIVVHFDIVRASSLSGNHRSATSANHGLSSSELDLRSLTNHHINRSRLGRATVEGSHNLIRTSLGDSQVFSGSIGRNIILVPHISGRLVRNNISIQRGRTTVANIEFTRDRHRLRSSNTNIVSSNHITIDEVVRSRDVRDTTLIADLTT